MAVLKDIPVDVRVAFEGKRVRSPDMQLEFGGMKVPVKLIPRKAEEKE